jgi:phospholipid/cholesterol/gamma-HCH transport system permease protein
MGWVQGLGELSLLCKEVAISLATHRISGRDWLYQLYFIGVKSQSVVLITGAFTGMVLAAQTYFQFHRVRMETATLAVVGVGMCSELGPVLTGLMVAGRVGAALAAELGTMRVTEQIDALETMAIDPVPFLVTPRIVAGLMMLPVLTILADFIAIVGGYVVAISFLDVSSHTFLSGLKMFFHLKDVLAGLVKAFVFGGIIAIVGCHQGLQTSGGARGVGQSTTRAVVIASVLILIGDYIIASILF